MKKLLIPTDFSECSLHALDAGRKYIARYGGEMLIYHCAELPEGWERWSWEIKNNHPELLRIANLATEKLDFFLKENQDLGIESNRIIGGGNFIEEIEKIATEKEIDLIIMGSHGVGGKQELFIGSNTQKVVRKIDVDTLILKEPIKSIAFNKVLFASNLDEKDKDAFLKLLDFVEPFRPEEIHIMAVNTVFFFSQPTILMQQALDDFGALAKDYNCITHFFRDYTVEGGIRKLSDELGIDLISIANYEKHPLKRMLQGSNVEMLVNHADLPVLCIT